MLIDGKGGVFELSLFLFLFEWETGLKLLGIRKSSKGLCTTRTVAQSNLKLEFLLFREVYHRSDKIPPLYCCACNQNLSRCINYIGVPSVKMLCAHGRCKWRSFEVVTQAEFIAPNTTHLFTSLNAPLLC